MAVYNFRGTSPAGYEVGAGGVTKDRLVKLGTAVGTVVASTAATDEHVGFATETRVAGDTVAIQDYGKARAVASAAIAIGAKLMFATGGKVATAAGVTSRVVGVALTPAAADGDVIEIECTFPALMPLGS